MTHPKIHILIFSCGSHAPYLELALHSLARVKASFLGMVYVGEDPHDPLQESAKYRFESLGLNITYTCWGKVTGYGEVTVMSELRAFQEIAASVPACDWIAKVDSDVLFLGSQIFDRVLTMNSDLVGHKEQAWGTFAYSQGGCYFLRAGFVAALADIGAREVEQEAETLLKAFHDVAAENGMWKMPQCPEDALVHRLVKKRNGRIRLKHYYLPLWQLDRLSFKHGAPRLEGPTLKQWLASPRLAMGIVMHNFMLARNRYSVIHFMSCKERMPEIFRLLRMGEACCLGRVDDQEVR